MTYQLHEGDSLAILKTLPDESVNCCITSPPYFNLRDYGVAGQIGLEDDADVYVARLVSIFDEVKRVLTKDGSLWLNLGDTYVDKSLAMIPARTALALKAKGWLLRSEIVWHKPNPMPESVKDRPTRAHEMLYLMTKQARYYFDYQAIKEPAKTKPHAPGWKKTPMTPDGPMRTRGPAFADRIFGADGKRMKRDVWSVPIYQFKGAHFATFPPKLITPCVLAGCPAGGVVLDCFSGSATTGLVALQHGRRYVGIELNPEYNDIARQRLNSFSSSTLIDS